MKYTIRNPYPKKQWNYHYEVVAEHPDGHEDVYPLDVSSFCDVKAAALVGVSKFLEVLEASGAQIIRPATEEASHG